MTILLFKYDSSTCTLLITGYVLVKFNSHEYIQKIYGQYAVCELWEDDERMKIK